MNKKAFTLTEMLIVVIIISGLMMLIIPNLGSTKDSVDNRTCDAYVKLVDSQIQAFYLDKGVYPKNISELLGKYLEQDTCPNGTKIAIVDNKAIIIDE